MEIKTISAKKFSMIFLLSIPVIIAITVALSLILSSEVYVLLIFPLILVMLFVSKKMAGQVKKIDVGDENVSINQRTIDYKTIKGYHINRTGLMMSSLDLRLDSGEVFSITCPKSGIHGRNFEMLTGSLIKAIEEKNKGFVPMNYQEVHVRQMKFLRPMIILGIILVLFVDLVAVLSLVFGEKWFPWQIVFINVVLLSLVPYLKSPKTGSR